jgi:hypothetical protein
MTVKIGAEFISTTRTINVELDSGGVRADAFSFITGGAAGPETGAMYSTVFVPFGFYSDPTDLAGAMKTSLDASLTRVNADGVTRPANTAGPFTGATAVTTSIVPVFDPGSTVPTYRLTGSVAGTAPFTVDLTPRFGLANNDVRGADVVRTAFDRIRGSADQNAPIIIDIRYTNPATGTPFVYNNTSRATEAARVARGIISGSTLPVFTGSDPGETQIVPASDITVTVLTNTFYLNIARVGAAGANDISIPNAITREVVLRLDPNEIVAEALLRYNAAHGTTPIQIDFSESNAVRIAALETIVGQRLLALGYTGDLAVTPTVSLIEDTDDEFELVINKTGATGTAPRALAYTLRALAPSPVQAARSGSASAPSEDGSVAAVPFTVDINNWFAANGSPITTYRVVSAIDVAASLNVMNNVTLTTANVLSYTPSAAVQAPRTILIIVSAENSVGTGTVALTVTVNPAGSGGTWQPPAVPPAVIDVPSGAWFNNSVGWAYANGITGGTSNTTFSPNRNVTRAEFIVFLYRANGSPNVSGTNPFTDLTGLNAEFRNAILWAYNRNITTGSPSGSNTFKPNDYITRQELAVMLYRSEGAGATPADALGSYTDRGDVASWANVAVNWAVVNGVIGQNTGNRLNPGSTATRAEAVTMLYRVVG